MPYDAEDMRQNEPSCETVRPRGHKDRRKVYGRDLEAIVTLLELAALELSPEPGVRFARDALLDTARRIGGPSIELEEKDVDIVLRNIGFLKKVAANEYYLK